MQMGKHGTRRRKRAERQSAKMRVVLTESSEAKNCYLGSMLAVCLRRLVVIWSTGQQKKP